MKLLEDVPHLLVDKFAQIPPTIRITISLPLQRRSPRTERDRSWVLGALPTGIIDKARKKEKSENQIERERKQERDEIVDEGLTKGTEKGGGCERPTFSHHLVFLVAVRHWEVLVVPVLPSQPFILTSAFLLLPNSHTALCKWQLKPVAILNRIYGTEPEP